MSDTAAAPAVPAANSTPSNGTSKGQAPAVVPVRTDTATGPQTPGQPRGQDGKFAPKAGEQHVDDDPEIDLGDVKLKKSQLKAELGRARSFSKQVTEVQKRAAQAEAIEKAHRERMEALKKDPKNIAKLLREAGLDDNGVRAALMDLTYSEVVEPEQLTAEQKRIRQLEAEAAERKARDDAEAEKTTKAEQEKADLEAQTALEQEIVAALEAGKVPNSKAAIRRISQKMAQLETRGIHLPVDQVALLVKREIGSEMAEFLLATDIPGIIELAGKDAAKKLFGDLAKWAAAQRQPGAIAQPPKPKVQAPAPSDSKLTPQQFDELMRSRLTGKG